MQVLTLLCLALVGWIDVEVEPEAEVGLEGVVELGVEPESAPWGRSTRRRCHTLRSSFLKWRDMRAIE